MIKPGIALLLAATLSYAAWSHAGDRVEKRYRLPGHGYLQMEVPAAWDDDLKQPRGGLPPTIEFRARHGKPFAVLVTPIWPASADVPPSTAESIRRSVEQAAEKAAPQAVEATLRLVELKGAAGPGFYFSATDSAPKPDEFKFMTQGIVKVADLLVTFTILTNDGQADVAREAIDAIRSARHIATSGGTRKAPLPRVPDTVRGTKI